MEEEIDLGEEVVDSWVLVKKKRRPPPAVAKLLDFDKQVTDRFVLWANGCKPLTYLILYSRALEISCHGVGWFSFWIAFTWLIGDNSYIQMQVNLLIGLFVDVTFVAIAKAYFRRRRPTADKNDIYSFPSGHASRAFFVAYFFTHLYPTSMVWYVILVPWAAAVSLSRILINKHYILDVLAGVVMGLTVGAFMNLIWLEDRRARWLMSFWSDEYVYGGEYHV